jgi:hypothetical protein
MRRGTLGTKGLGLRRWCYQTPKENDNEAGMKTDSRGEKELLGIYPFDENLR